MNEVWRALAREADLAAEHLAFGATTLGRANYAQQAYYAQAFFSLSIGFERVCKLIFIVDHAVDSDGNFPTERQVRSFGHDLSRLLTAVSTIAERHSIDAVLPSTQIHQNIVSVLSSFATNVTRYYNIGVITGQIEGDAIDPVADWHNRVTSLVLSEHYTERRRSHDEANAQMVHALIDEISIIRHEDEAGNDITSAYEGAIATARGEFARSWERMYVMQLARFVSSVISHLGDRGEHNHLRNIPYFSDFFYIFDNSDSYFRNRKTWSTYR